MLQVQLANLQAEGEETTHLNLKSKFLAEG